MTDTDKRDPFEGLEHLVPGMKERKERQDTFAKKVFETLAPADTDKAGRLADEQIRKRIASCADGDEVSREDFIALAEMALRVRALEQEVQSWHEGFNRANARAKLAESRAEASAKDAGLFDFLIESHPMMLFRLVTGQSFSGNPRDKTVIRDAIDRVFKEQKRG